MLLFRMIFKKFISEQRDRFYHQFMIDLLQIWLLPKWFIVSNIIHIFLCGNGKIIYCNILWYAAWNVNTNIKAMYGFLFVSSALCHPPVRIIPSKFSSYKMQIMMKIIFQDFVFLQLCLTQLKDFSDWREYSGKVMFSLLLLSIFQPIFSSPHQNPSPKNWMGLFSMCLISN